MMTSSSQQHLSAFMEDYAKQTSIKNHIIIDSEQPSETTMKHRETRKFIARNSLITDLYQISHIRCVRNAVIAAFIVLIVRGAVNDFMIYGRLNCTFELLSITVGKLHIVTFIWFVMKSSTTFLVYFATYTWASHRKCDKSSLKMYDTIWLILYVCYLIVFLVLPCCAITKYHLPIVSSVIVVAEQLRQMMKTHAFVRENAHKILRHSKTSAEQKCSHFNQYLYFLYAPTLIYRDVYPRTATIRWNYVLSMFGQFVTCVLADYYLFANYWVPLFQRFFTEDITLSFILMALFDMMLPGVFIVLISFYGFFHCWLNTFAEMLRFADRTFYLDWWNFTSSSSFWRTWNIVVHDWFFVYIYKDLSKLLNGRRGLSAACVVIISAIFHEYFMAAVLGFFCPVLIGWFGLFGMMLRFAFPQSKGDMWNIIFLTLMPVCVSIIPCLYVMEASALYSTVPRKTFWNTMFQWSGKPQSTGEL